MPGRAVAPSAHFATFSPSGASATLGAELEYTPFEQCASRQLGAALQVAIHVTQAGEPTLEGGAWQAFDLLLELARLERRRASALCGFGWRCAVAQGGFEAHEL